QPWVFDRSEQLDAVIKVPEHAVGASNIGFALASISEIVDSTVFKEPADDASNPDCRGQSGYAGSERADPSHDQVDRQLGLRSFIQGTNQLGVGHVVDLEYQFGFTACLFVLNLALDHLDQTVTEVGRGNQ